MHYGAEWEWKVRACSSKRICMAGWMLLRKQWACKIFISTGSVHGSPWPAGWSSGSSICYFPFPFLSLCSGCPTFSLLQASLKTTLSFYTFPVWILFSFHTCQLYSLPPHLLREHQVSFNFITFASWLSSFLLLIAPYCFNGYSELWPRVHIQRVITVHGHATQLNVRTNQWLGYPEQFEINDFLKQILKPFRRDETPDWISNLQWQ